MDFDAVAAINGEIQKIRHRIQELDIQIEGLLQQAFTAKLTDLAYEEAEIKRSHQETKPWNALLMQVREAAASKKEYEQKKAALERFKSQIKGKAVADEIYAMEQECLKRTTAR